MAHLVMHSAFEELSTAHKLIQELVVNPDGLSPHDCFSIHGKIEISRPFIHRRLVASVLLFQSGMEGIYDWMCSVDTSLPQPRGFVKKWEEAIEQKELTISFLEYKDFYENVRNAITHPDRPERFDTINNLDFIEVYFGIKSGWAAFESLSNAIGRPHDNDSWVIMCKANGVPDNIDRTYYPNLKKLSSQLLEKFSDFYSDENKENA